MSEARTLRLRQAAAQLMASRTEYRESDCSAAVIALTAVATAYPTNAAAFYVCLPVEIDGTEAEGATASYVSTGSHMMMALNIGSQIPPVGTPIVCHSVGGRWCFRYDG